MAEADSYGTDARLCHKRLAGSDQTPGPAELAAADADEHQSGHQDESAGRAKQQTLPRDNDAIPPGSPEAYRQGEKSDHSSVFKQPAFCRPAVQDRTVTTEAGRENNPN